jgi:prepilin signal peptidase PulO-like enzyme (type II secretory pathway)
MQKIMTYVALTAGVLFILFGIVLLVMKSLIIGMPQQYRIMMGIIFILYGLFRLINVYTKRQRQDESEI